MAKKSKTPNPFTGRWRIVSMEQFDQDYVDEEEEGYFEFTEKGWGEFHFGNVHGQMDLGLLHFVGLPLVLEANKNGAINLPSIEDTGVGFHLTREPIFYGLLTVGVDRCLFGVILFLCVPELKKGRRIAWRICVVVGLFMLLGYTPLVWIGFERAHLPSLVMPAIELLILVPLLLG